MYGQTVHKVSVDRLPRGCVRPSVRRLCRPPSRIRHCVRRAARRGRVLLQLAVVVTLACVLDAGHHRRLAWTRVWTSSSAVSAAVRISSLTSGVCRTVSQQPFNACPNSRRVHFLLFVLEVKYFIARSVSSCGRVLS